MPDVFSGDILTAALLRSLTNAGSSSVSSVNATSFTTNSTSYTTTTNPGGVGVVGVTFVAPTSGVVMIQWEAAIATSGSTGCLISFEVRTGASIGSGTPVTAADDARAVDTRTSTNTRPANFFRLEGLAPGTYNVQLVHKSLSAANSTILRRELSVTPIQ